MRGNIQSFGAGFLAFLCLFSLIGCAQAKSSVGANVTEENTETTGGYRSFCADSAYSFIKKQLDFGPRVPGTQSHKNAGEWISSKISEWTDTVIIQEGTVTAYNGDILPAKNIFGSINPEVKDRVLLVAHWDSRPWADEETNPELRNRPIPGANDGASGVAVILELARNLREAGYDKGVDFLFVDVEDYGRPEGESFWSGGSEDSWCLGTQLWTKEMPYKKGYMPRYAILLDMVGGYDAKFYREYFSELHASKAVDEVWSAAVQTGHSNRFINERAGAVTDDHIYLSKAGIPAIDIIECNNPQTGSFNPTWHTMADDLGNIDRSTLKAVGETVLFTILNRK